MRLYVVLLVVGVFANACLCWGPLTHYYIGTMVLKKVKQKYSGIHEESFLNGCMAPDFAKNAADQYHSVDYLYSLYDNIHKFPSNSSFDPRSFVLGFATHLAADVVAHHSGSLYTGDLFHDLSIDGYLYRAGGSQGHWRILEGQPGFMLQAAQDFAKYFPKVPHDRGTIMNGLGGYNFIIFGELIQIGSKSLEDFESQMVETDPCHGADFAAAKVPLDLSMKWNDETAEWLWKMLPNTEIGPSMVRKIMEGNVNQLYDFHGKSVC